MLLPFRVDIAYSLKNDIRFDLELLNDDKTMSTSLLKAGQLSPTKKQLKYAPEFKTNPTRCPAQSPFDICC